MINATLKRTLTLSIFLLIIISCKERNEEPSSEVSALLSVDNFTPVEEIDPQKYFATAKNMAIDPNNQLMDIFRKKKAADMADENKPRPFSNDQIGQIENISHQQPWAPLKNIFKFDWNKIDKTSVDNLSKNIKARRIFDNADLKVTEVALAPNAILPLHAQATPSVYFILGGMGAISSDNSTAQVSVGTSIKFDSYSKKRVENISDEPLKILWFSWAPEGDKSYLESGYYLTGSFPQIQTINAVLPQSFDFWEASKSEKYELIETKGNADITSDFVKKQNRIWNELEKREFYPKAPIYRSANEVDWVDVMNMNPKSFFFAEDLKSLGSTLKMMSKLAKIKSVFRVERPEGGYDLNYSFLAWGPQSKYITHSHAICEFYYILEGDVEYIINDIEYHGVPGNFYFHPPYYDHEMRGLKKNVPFLSISGSWIPFGRRELFDLPFLLLEDISIRETGNFPIDFDFHDFDMKKEGVEYGKL